MVGFPKVEYSQRKILGPLTDDDLNPIYNFDRVSKNAKAYIFNPLPNQFFFQLFEGFPFRFR